MSEWGLPGSVVVSGTEYRINADYRDILDIVSRLNEVSNDKMTDLYVALALFYQDFEVLPESDYPEAVKAMFDFIRCGEPEPKGSSPKQIDWEQDARIIVADINRVAGCEIRSLPFCHWWTFIAWFNAIGDGQLATVVAIRDKLRRGKKLDDWEREYYRNHREKVDFQTKYTSVENEMVKKMLGR